MCVAASSAGIRQAHLGNAVNRRQVARSKSSFLTPPEPNDTAFNHHCQNAQVSPGFCQCMKR